MAAIYKREMGAYFKGMFGYVVAGFLLIFIGICTAVYNLLGGYSKFEYALAALTIFYLVAIPFLTMRSFAEEQRHKTDQLLYSLPIPMVKVVLGKYLAMLTVLALPLAIMCFYPLILSMFGTVNFAGAYSGMVGFFLLGAALIALGMFVSTLTENVAVAAGMSFLCIGIIYLIPSLAGLIPESAFSSFVCFTVAVLLIGLVFYFMTKNWTLTMVITVVLELILAICYYFWNNAFINLFPTVLEQLSLFDRLNNFYNEIFDISAVVYDLSFAAVFLFLTTQALEKRRWS
jgi:ABC-2 type transport system permease protein